MNNGLSFTKRKKLSANRIIKAKAEQQKREAAFRKRLAEVIGAALMAADLPA